MLNPEYRRNYLRDSAFIRDEINPAFDVHRSWPEERVLTMKAGALLIAKGTLAKFDSICHDIKRGKAASWLPREKHALAEIFIRLRMAGFEVSPENVNRLGLKADEAHALEQLIKTY